MFLTHIELDPGRRLARKYLGSAQVMHAVVMAACGDAGEGTGRVLWRVDPGPTTSLYVLSPTEPDCTQILDEAGAIGSQARTRDYTPFLQRLEADQRWAFRLAANPSRAVSQGIGIRGKRFGHVTVEQQRQWLISRTEKYGFKVGPPAEGAQPEEDSSVVVVRRERPVFGRRHPDGNRRDRVTISRTVYEGTLLVTDPDLLRQALTTGIGRSKAYGCGLMTLARPHGG